MDVSVSFQISDAKAMAALEQMFVCMGPKKVRVRAPVSAQETLGRVPPAHTKVSCTRQRLPFDDRCPACRVAFHLAKAQRIIEDEIWSKKGGADDVSR